MVRLSKEIRTPSSIRPCTLPVTPTPGDVSDRAQTQLRGETLVQNQSARSAVEQYLRLETVDAARNDDVAKSGISNGSQEVLASRPAKPMMGLREGPSSDFSGAEANKAGGFEERGETAAPESRTEAHAGRPGPALWRVSCFDTSV